MFGFLKSQQTQKLLALGLLGILLIAIPLTIWYGVSQQQTAENHAASVVPREQHYACGSSLTVLMSQPQENPTCGNGTVNGLTSFQSTIILKAQSGSHGAYHVKWAWAQYWCPTEDPHAPCLSNGTLAQSSSGGDGLTGNGSAFVTARSAVKTPTSEFAGQACGYYQNDFGFQVFSNDSGAQLCGISLDLNSLGNTNNNASYCHSGKSCTTITPTNTPTATPTPTETVTPTDTPTPTTTPTQHHECRQNACVLVSGDGSDSCTSDSDCQVTATPTTPTTPTPTVPVTVTPKPTLPPTGPGNALVTIGAVGAAAAIIGTIVLLAL